MMITLVNEQKRFFLFILSISMLLLNCWEFLSINQPDFVAPNSVFEVPITISYSEYHGDAYWGGIGFFGILLPTGWTVEDNILYSGALSGKFTYSSEFSDSMENYENAPTGYYWWVSVSDSSYLADEGTVSFTPKIHNDSQSGNFYLKYMLADSFVQGNDHITISEDYVISVNAPMTATVSNTNDSGEGSLRQAIKDVSSRGEIFFNLAYPATIGLDSELVIDRNLTINGPESGKLTISGNNQTRVFYLNRSGNNINVKLSNLTISDGNSAIYCVNINLEIENIIITNNGYGLICYESVLVLKNVLIHGNIVNDGNGGGIYCEKSEVSLKNVRIFENSSSEDGGGIFCRNSMLDFSNVTICNNTASNVGGGIAFTDNSSILFDNDKPSNIYLNKAVLGNDLYSDNGCVINVALDTFTVLYPSSYYAYPANFNFDIQNAKLVNYDADLYVNSNGVNSNTGTSPDDAFRTLFFAFSRIAADSLNPHTIFIVDGIYSPSTNGEEFPLRIPNYVTLSGTSRENVILDAEQQGAVFIIFLGYQADNYPPPERLKQINQIENMTIKGGSFSGIRCWESKLILNNVIITENNSSTINPSNYDGGGGIICKYSILNLTDVIISDNVCEQNGGGIYIKDSDVNITSSEVSNNSAGNLGGGIHNDGNLSMTNVKLFNNTARQGGGICIRGEYSYLAGVTIAYNQSTYLYEGGAGIYFHNPSITFDPQNRCNIYLNKGRSNSGHDLCANHLDSIISVIVDTFTVLHPSDEYATPIDKYTFDILHDASRATEINIQNETLPTKFALKQNYPNPFNPVTMINYQLPMTSNVELSIYNLLGQKVTTLVNERKRAGHHQVEWDASNMASGVYLYRLEAEGFVETKKLVLLK